MLGLSVSGVVLLLLGAFGARVSPSLGKHRRLLVILGVVVLAIAVLPALVEGFIEGLRVGRELRR